MKINRPLLNVGDTIGIVPLSSPCQEHRFRAGLKFLESLGFKTRVMLNSSKAYGTSKFLFSSDSVPNRVRALETLFKDRSVKAILSTRGGYGAMEVLEHFDFSIARKFRKPLIGFSDTTAFLVALRQNAGCLTIHGPSLESFSTAHEREDSKHSATALAKFLLSKNWTATDAWTLTRVCGKGGASGEIIGGNLSILAAMCGTPWQVKLRDRILFLEEVGEKPYRVHRMLLQLKLCGALRGLRGVILGSFRNCEHEKKEGPSLDETLLNIFEELKVPVWKGVPAGHEALNIPIPFGIPLSLNDLLN